MCSHLHHIFLSSDLQIFSSSHLLIFLSSYLHIFSSSHLLSLSLPFSLSLSLSVSCPLSLSLSFFFLSLLNPQAVPTKRNEVATLSQFGWHKMLFFFDFSWSGGNLLARNEVRVSKTAVKLRFWSVGGPFRTKRGSSVKSCGKIATLVGPAATLSHVMKFECQKLRYNWRQPCRTKRGSRQTLQVFCEFGWSGGCPFARNEVRVSKTEGFWWV